MLDFVEGDGGGRTAKTLRKSLVARQELSTNSTHIWH